MLNENLNSVDVYNVKNAGDWRPNAEEKNCQKKFRVGADERQQTEQSSQYIVQTNSPFPAKSINC